MSANSALTSNSSPKKIALVTGSSRGIGKYIALKLASENYHVVLTARNETELKNTANEIINKNQHCSYIVCDMQTDSGLNAALTEIEKFGRLDVLVTNIGSGKTHNEISVDIAEWKRVFDINFFSVVSAINTFLPLLKKTKGQIVCISSIAGIEKISAPISYSVAKAAVISLVKQMMRPLSEQGVRINSISPGNVWIEGGSWDNKLKTDPERVNGIIQNAVALKKFVQPEEIANAVWFTISNPSVTGQNITIDAGQTRQSF